MSDLSAIKLNGTTYTLSDDYARDSMAKIEYGTLATKAYNVGDYLINNNHLYRVTSAIAIGVKFTVGTNIELVKLTDEVKLKAPLASPTFTGTPKVPTASTGTKTTQIASTAYVQNEIDIVNNNVQSTIDYVQNELGGVLTSLRGDLNSLDSEVDTISDDVDSLDSAVDILTRQGTTLRNDGIVVCNAVDGGDNVFFMIDDTLTEAHKAADAKATGNAIGELKENITNISTATSSDIGKALSPKSITNGKVTEWQYKSISGGGGGGGGTSDYSDLDNKPSIGGVTLAGSMSLSDIGAAAYSDVTQIGTAVNSINSVLGTKADTSDLSAETAARQSAISGIASDITAEANRAAAAESQKVSKPITDPNGTQGQVLQSDGNGGTTWGTVGSPTDAQVGDAVADWLDEHPDATTTVADGSISRVKLASAVVGDIDGKAPAIVSTSASGYNHDEAAMSAVTFSGNAYAWKTARYANRKNYLPFLTGSKTSYGITFTYDKGFIVYNGTPNSNGNNDIGYNVAVNIPAGEYLILCEIYQGETTIEVGRAPNIILTYEDDTTETITLPTATYSDVSSTVTISKAVKSINLKAGLRTSSVYSDYRMWYGIFPSDVTITDTQYLVTNGNTYEISISDIPVINTMQHESIVSGVVDTKEYVDRKVEAETEGLISDSDLVYVTPEMFGAVGNEVADDTSAINQAIAYGIANAVAVRGFGHYKVASTIEIIGNGADVFLEKVSYSGSATAVKITGERCKFGFSLLYALQSGAKGITFSTKAGKYTTGCRIDGMYLWAESHALYFYCEDGADQGGSSLVMSGNYFNIRRLRSTSGSVFYSTTGVSETVCLFGNVQNSVGYAFYLYNGDLNVLSANLEDANAGFLTYHGAFLLGRVRIGEMTNRQRADSEDPTTGMLFCVEEGGKGYITRYGSDPFFELFSMDVSKRDSGKHAPSHNIAYVIHAGRMRRYYNFNYLPDGDTVKTGNMQVEGECIIYSNRIAFVPDQKIACTVSVDTYAEDWKKVPPYRFVIAADDVKVYLGDSYCPHGISEFVVDQTSHVGDVYDRDNNLIFDGSTFGQGVFKVTMVQSDPVASASTLWGWSVGDPLDYVVEKLNIVS